MIKIAKVMLYIHMHMYVVPKSVSLTKMIALIK